MENTASNKASILYALSGVTGLVNYVLSLKQEFISDGQSNFTAIFSLLTVFVIAYLIMKFRWMKWVLLAFLIIGFPLLALSLPVIYSQNIISFILTLVGTVLQLVGTVILFLPKNVTEPQQTAA